jgi:hypothetical protein
MCSRPAACPRGRRRSRHDILGALRKRDGEQLRQPATLDHLLECRTGRDRPRERALRGVEEGGASTSAERTLHRGTVAGLRDGRQDGFLRGPEQLLAHASSQGRGDRIDDPDDDVDGEILPAVCSALDCVFERDRRRRREHGADHRREHETGGPCSEDGDGDAHDKADASRYAVGPGVEHLPMRPDPRTDRLDVLVEVPEVDLALRRGDVGILELLDRRVEALEVAVHRGFLIPGEGPAERARLFLPVDCLQQALALLVDRFRLALEHLRDVEAGAAADVVEDLGIHVCVVHERIVVDPHPDPTQASAILDGELLELGSRNIDLRQDPGFRVLPRRCPARARRSTSSRRGELAVVRRRSSALSL